jgi:hypothetical protein
MEAEEHTGQPRCIPMKDDPKKPTFKKIDRCRLKNIPGRPELFWVDEEDLLEIEFNVCGPLVPNPVGRLIATFFKS